MIPRLSGQFSCLALGLMFLVGCSSVSLDEPAPIYGDNQSGATKAPGAQAGAVSPGARSEQSLQPLGGSPSGAMATDGQLLSGPDGVPYGSVYFGFDSIEIGRDYQSLLERTADVLKQYPNQSLVIEGNTDDLGTSEYNIALGQRRAQAVLRALTILGAPDTRIEPVSNGEEKPRDRGQTEAARAENRRADLFFKN